MSKCASKTRIITAPLDVSALTSAQLDQIFGSLTVSAGPDADPSNATSSAAVGRDDVVHFYSADGSLVFAVTQGSGLVDAQINPAVLSGITHTAITGVDLTQSGDDLFVQITWTDENGVSQTTTDPTPVTITVPEPNVFCAGPYELHSFSGTAGADNTADSSFIPTKTGIVTMRYRALEIRGSGQPGSAGVSVGTALGGNDLVDMPLSGPERLSPDDVAKEVSFSVTAGQEVFFRAFVGGNASIVDGLEFCVSDEGVFDLVDSGRFGAVCIQRGGPLRDGVAGDNTYVITDDGNVDISQGAEPGDFAIDQLDQDDTGLVTLTFDKPVTLQIARYRTANDNRIVWHDIAGQGRTEFVTDGTDWVYVAGDTPIQFDLNGKTITSNGGPDGVPSNSFWGYLTTERATTVTLRGLNLEAFNLRTMNAEVPVCDEIASLKDAGSGWAFDGIERTTPEGVLGVSDLNRSLLEFENARRLRFEGWAEPSDGADSIAIKYGSRLVDGQGFDNLVAQVNVGATPGSGGADSFVVTQIYDTDTDRVNGASYNSEGVIWDSGLPGFTFRLRDDNGSEVAAPGDIITFDADGLPTFTQLPANEDTFLTDTQCYNQNLDLVTADINHGPLVGAGSAAGGQIELGLGGFLTFVNNGTRRLNGSAGGWSGANNGNAQITMTFPVPMDITLGFASLGGNEYVTLITPGFELELTGSGNFDPNTNRLTNNNSNNNERVTWRGVTEVRFNHQFGASISASGRILALTSPLQTDINCYNNLAGDAERVIATVGGKDGNVIDVTGVDLSVYNLEPCVIGVVSEDAGNSLSLGSDGFPFFESAITNEPTGLFLLGEDDQSAAPIPVEATSVVTGLDLTQATKMTLRLHFRDVNLGRPWQAADIDVDGMLLRFAAGDTIDAFGHMFDNDYVTINVIDPATGELSFQDEGREMAYVRAELTGRATLLNLQPSWITNAPGAAGQVLTANGDGTATWV